MLFKLSPSECLSVLKPRSDSLLLSPGPSPHNEGLRERIFFLPLFPPSLLHSLILPVFADTIHALHAQLSKTLDKEEFDDDIFDIVVKFSRTCRGMNV